MHTRMLPVLVCLIMFLSCPSIRGGSLAADAAPYGPGEILEYDLYWEFIPAGTARLEVSPTVEYGGLPAYHFIMTVRTNSFIDRFYKVRDQIESFTDRPLNHSLLYRKKQQEGRHRRDILVTFDWERSVAEYSNFDKKQKPIAIVGGTVDPLSILYALRLMPLEENTEVEIPVTDGKKCVIGKAKVGERQRVRVRDKVYETYVLEPDLKDLGGIFRKSEGAKVRIWVTDDELRIPVRVTSKVSVGYFIAELKEARDAPAGNGER